VTAALKIRETVGDRRIASVRVRMNPYETGYAGMDSKGPFNSISGTLMSIPFCIASTLLRGVPTMKNMTTYDDAGVNELVARTTLVPDDGVAKLCCIIDVALADGTLLAQDTRMTTKDYDFDRAAVNALVRRIGDETGIPQKAYDHLNAFVESLPGADLGLVLRAFAMIPGARAASR
jgi:2-methylcitrate dehydratase PrpD